MRVRDLLDDEVMGVALRTRDDDPGLDMPISGCAQSELMDPTPFLLRGELMLTTGMGLQFQDPRTWDAYVERLASVAISAIAFGVGRVHAQIPEGLRVACAAHGVPLVEVAADLPLLQLSRHIWHELAAQRHELVRRGWELADECTRLATRGMPIAEVLERVAHAVEARVTLLDPTGFALASAGAAGRRTAATATLPLPGGAGARFLLRVQGARDGQLLQPLLGPVGAVLAMQLTYTLASTSPLHDLATTELVDALRSETASIATFVQLARSAGFADADPWQLVMLTTPDREPSTVLRMAAWRLRVALEEHATLVRVVESSHAVTIVLQWQEPTGSLAAILEAQQPTPSTSARYAADVMLDELPIALRMADRLPFLSGPHPLPTLDLVAIARALPVPGLTRLAERLVAPLTVADASGGLVETLQCYLERSGATKEVSEALFIHRNTLAYRIRRIESLLDIDLADGETRSTLLLALRMLQERRAPSTSG